MTGRVDKVRIADLVDGDLFIGSHAYNLPKQYDSWGFLYLFQCNGDRATMLFSNDSLENFRITSAKERGQSHFVPLADVRSGLSNTKRVCRVGANGELFMPIMELRWIYLDRDLKVS